MIKNENTRGHLLALITIIIWGTTFISTKVLLEEFSPVEILFFRFIIGYFVLLVAYPKKLKLIDRKQEWYFIFAGITGVTLYFLLENIALTYTLASNVGVIVSINSFFTALLAHFFLKKEKLEPRFFKGFAVAMIGILLINFNSSKVLMLNPLGDILAVFAAIVWAVYSTLIKKISEFKYNIILVTRKVFFYGIIFMMPALFIYDLKINLNRFSELNNLLNILFLGIGASALCFGTWNYCVKVLGVVKTSVYIYLVHIVTLLTSAIILKEKITFLSLLGTIITLGGLVILEKKDRNMPLDEKVSEA
ncbi:DMT family transporter [Clostridium sp. YIM B02506]|uniref:DMT family transporter n=1 Tax=Clostridium sp. YIM B02506 TaxID=2910680 RepID=UPI001EED03A0|nr:DMT family transporter [Clostridium sp. YIM B02506]